MLPQFTSSVTHCASCGEDHHLPLVFRKLPEALFLHGLYWHYEAKCPKTNEPVYAREISTILFESYIIP